MKTAKPPAPEPPSHRRSQPVRQTRTNPPRTLSGGPNQSGPGRDSIGGGHAPNQPIDIFPATTYFADAITALPRELVRHFTLLKEVEAKTFAPEEALFKLVESALKTPLPSEARSASGSASGAASGSASVSAQNSESGIVLGNSVQPVPSTSTRDSHGGAAAVFDPSNLPRRQLYRQTAFKINELIGSLEEKNHVISTANEALQKQLARIEDVWPHLESEYSDEAKWGSTTHWAYPENRTGRASHAERARREGASAISAAAQALAEEAAARSDARKQAVMAKKNLKTQQQQQQQQLQQQQQPATAQQQQQPPPHQESDFDDAEARAAKAEPAKKSQGNGKVRKTAPTDASAGAGPGGVGLGITAGGAATNGSAPAPKRRKVEKPANGGPAPAERAMASVFGGNAPKPKTTSPRETPAPEPKKRKALPNSNGQTAKKSRNGVAALSPSVASSPVLSSFPDPKTTSRSSPAPANTARPQSSRARQNSTQSSVEAVKARPASAVTGTNKPNGSVPGTPDLPASNSWPKAANEAKPAKESVVTAAAKPEAQKREPEQPESAPPTVPSGNKKDVVKIEEPDRKTEPPVTQVTTIMTVTKSGRASKPSTPALATFQEAAARSRAAARASEPAGGSTTAGAGAVASAGGGQGPQSSGNNNNNNKRTMAKKTGGASTAAQQLAAAAADEDGASSVPGDDDEADAADPDETFCYCNGVSYGEMIACDAQGCEREWFHLECVGLKVAPKGNAKWYCENCKERIKMGGKKSNSR